MEVKTIELEKGFPLQIVTKRIISYKPIRNKDGDIRYKDALTYLCRVLPPNEPSLPVIFGLASFSINNNLSEKQRKLADKFIYFWEEKGVL
ncbi:MAG: hypothetical protein J6T10_26875 [Methanobrevibacter sp.]|nr:hypothetical protein [Methanobrevibacter sp.]